MASPLVPSHRVTEADWFGAGLNGFGGRVDQVVPMGYPAYARILHPASNDRGEPAPWSEVAARERSVLHPLAQFHALAGRRQYDRRQGIGWPGENPEEGSLATPQLPALCQVLERHTTTPDQCWLTVWEGFGNLPEKWRRTAPRVQQPHRAYYIFGRPLRDVLEFSIRIVRAGRDQDPLPPSMAPLVAATGSMPEQRPESQIERRSELPVWVQSPNQWWPQDRAWCVASEIDFDSTLVAGSQELVAEVMSHPQLEAFEVSSTDDLTHAGDKINPPPAPR